MSTLQRRTAGFGILASGVLVIIAAAHIVRAQPMRHGGPVLFVAAATGNQVVPPNTSSASATGAFLVDATERRVTYELTYHGLENGPPQRIELHNFGAGGNGPRVYTLCGDDGAACPKAVSGNITGSWDQTSKNATQLDTKMLGEFASARIYIEVVGGNERAEIRAQLEPNGAMIPVRNFVAHLASTRGGNGTGTAVLSEAQFADGRVSVMYHVTVAETQGTPDGVALVGVSGAVGAAAQPPRFPRSTALPSLKVLSSKTPARGGTLTGQYEARQERTDAVLATKLLSAGNRDVGITVRTSRFPEGELFGVFKPVH
jgi:CHRD domain